MAANGVAVEIEYPPGDLDDFSLPRALDAVTEVRSTCGPVFVFAGRKVGTENLVRVRCPARGA